MRTKVLSLFVGLLLAGCGSAPINVLKITKTGGDARPLVNVTATGQVDPGNVNIGDTVVFAPGSMRAVVAAPEFTVTLTERSNVTEREIKKSLSVNRREGAKIGIRRGRLINGDFFQQGVGIDINEIKPTDLDIDLTTLIFNRGEKPFRGDLTVYDYMPPEFEILGNGTAAKYNDRTGVKDFLSVIPILGLVAVGMDNFSRSSDQVDMQVDRLGEVSRLTFRRLVLEPGQAVGFVTKTRYRLPTPEELEELRLGARRAGP